MYRNLINIGIVLVLCNFVHFTIEQNFPDSPCPELFSYDYNGNEVVGLLQIPTTLNSQNIKVNVVMSLGAKLPSSYVGVLELYDTRTQAALNARRRQPIHYRILFPLQNPLPKLTKVTVNFNDICNGPPVYASYVTTIRLEHSLYIDQPNGGGNDYENFNQPSGIDDFNFNSNNNNNYDRPNTPFQLPQNTFGSNIFQLPQNNVNNRPIEQTFIVRPTQPPATRPPIIFETRPQTTAPTRVQIPEQTQQSDAEICGRPHEIFQFSPLVVSGETIKRGSFPWLVAIYELTPTGHNFICGGNLISSKVVLTAAHCMQRNGKRTSPKNIHLFLGRHNIRRWREEDMAESEVEAIYIHEDYKKLELSADADIAIVILKDRVTYNKYIRPICLWTGLNDIENIVGQEGTVVGWGRDESDNIVTDEPKKVRIPIVSDSVCLRSNDGFVKTTSKRTFCAGARNGIGPCNGDSGGGLFMQSNSKWVLRGLVSVSIADLSNTKCDLSNYVVFTDVSKFIDWIQPYTVL